MVVSPRGERLGIERASEWQDNRGLTRGYELVNDPRPPCSDFFDIMTNAHGPEARDAPLVEGSASMSPGSAHAMLNQGDPAVMTGRRNTWSGLVLRDLCRDATDDRPLTRPRWRSAGRSPAEGEAGCQIPSPPPGERVRARGVLSMRLAMTEQQCSRMASPCRNTNLGWAHGDDHEPEERTLRPRCNVTVASGRPKRLPLAVSHDLE